VPANRWRSYVDPSLEEAAVDAVRTWKPKPATDTDGNVVPVLQTIEITVPLY
jgi:outer membrane biosynthesis protein TonB